MTCFLLCEQKKEPGSFPDSPSQSFRQYFFEAFVKIPARHQNARTASLALDPDIHSDTDDLPTVCSARMLFFHFDIIMKIVRFWHHRLDHHSLVLCSS